MIDTEVIQERYVFSEDNLLRSINIVFDADHPERIQHFFPTSKSVELLKKLIDADGHDSLFVVAPYGSGKSLLASFFQQVIENRIDAVRQLQPVFDRIGDLDPVLAEMINTRCGEEQIFRPSGIAVPLTGYVKNVPRVIADGVVASVERTGNIDRARRIQSMTCESMDELVAMLTHMRETFASEYDHIEILWDEFGRHLEEIVVRGEAHRLNELQMLAEFGARSRRIKVGISLFLHQNLMRYAANVPQTVISEWKKVEGRFHTHQFVDDSKEVVSLAARVIESRFGDRKPSDETVQEFERQVREVGLFGDLKDEELSQVVVSAWPVLPAALYALPRISSRVAQNERTLFSFLFSLDTPDIVTVADVFDYFSDLMRSDSTFGGTYHHWLETITTLENAESAVEERVIKTLSIFGLGLAGERNRVSLELLVAAASIPGQAAETRKAIGELVGRKLLLYRKNSDTVLLWHTSDIDLRGRLESEKTRLFVSFDLLSYLNELLPAEDWRPVEYNASYKLFRFFSGYYVAAREASDLSLLSRSWDVFGRSGDGAVLYVLAENTEELDTVRRRLTETIVLDDRLVWILPRTTEGLFETALEAAAIGRLLKDSSLISEDPLVLPELQHMLDDSLGYLMRLVEKLYTPSPEGPEVISQGRSMLIRSRREFRSYLSDIMATVYSETPIFNNELINKSNPSQVLVNARKKLVLGILDRYGTSDLGIDGNRPDRSMFSTILLRTGLYFCDAHGRWRFAHPHELADDRLRAVWQVVHDFFSSDPGRRRSFGELYGALQARPYGIRKGVIPILLASGFRAFPSAVTLTDETGDYIPDIKPSVIEEIAKSPESYGITIVPLNEKTRQYLHQIEEIFSSRYTVETDPLRRCYDAIEEWKASLPAAALQSRKFDERARLFQKLVLQAKDPAKFLLEDLFRSYGVTIDDSDKLIEHLAGWKSQLEGVVSQYYEASSRSILSSLQLDSDGSVRDAGTQWVRLLPEDIEAQLQDGVSKAVIQRFGVSYSDDESLLDSIASLLIGKRIDRWDDSTIALFDREFRNAVRRIEDQALDTKSDGSSDAGIARDLITARIRSLFSRLRQTVGTEEAHRVIAEITTEV